MENTTLEVMTAIEVAAQEVLDGYRDNIEQLRVAQSNELSALSDDLDQKIEDELAQVTVENQHRLSELQESISATVAQNDLAVRSALTNQREKLVKEIVDKVVECYGD